VFRVGICSGPLTPFRQDMKPWRPHWVEGKIETTTDLGNEKGVVSCAIEHGCRMQRLTGREAT